MDNFWRHAHERLSQAVCDLATSPKSLGVRLDRVYWNHINDLREEELPPEFQQDLANLKSKLGRGQALALTNPDNTDDAVAIAQALHDLHLRVWALRQEALDGELRRNVERELKGQA